MREKNAPDMTSKCSVKCPEVGDFLEKPPPERGWWQKQEREETKVPQAAPHDEVSQAWLGGFAGPESPELPSKAADMLVFLRAGDGWSGCKVPSSKDHAFMSTMTHFGERESCKCTAQEEGFTG